MRAGGREGYCLETAQDSVLRKSRVSRRETTFFLFLRIAKRVIFTALPLFGKGVKSNITVTI